jgi:hypothetical protein
MRPRHILQKNICTYLYLYLYFLVACSCFSRSQVYALYFQGWLEFLCLKYRALVVVRNDDRNRRKQHRACRRECARCAAEGEHCADVGEPEQYALQCRMRRNAFAHYYLYFYLYCICSCICAVVRTRKVSAFAWLVSCPYGCVTYIVVWVCYMRMHLRYAYERFSYINVCVVSVPRRLI